jgi:hypothetical protein
MVMCNFIIVDNYGKTRYIAFGLYENEKSRSF